MKIAQLREALESVTAEQRYLKAREARHRHSKLNYQTYVLCLTNKEFISHKMDELKLHIYSHETY